MKETGCDLDQAISALKIANGDFEKAVKIINALFKYIVALKGKFMIESQNIYGLFITITNIKLETFLRHTVVVGYTPVIYQSNLQLNWRNLERNLYTLRLEEGVDQELTRRLQSDLENAIKNREDDLFYRYLENHDLEASGDLLRGIIINSFSRVETFNLPLKLSLQLEESSVAQFTEIAEPDLVGQSTSPEKLPFEMEDAIILEIALQPDETDGMPVAQLKQGLSVAAKITDQRDIAQYLSRLMSGEKQNNQELFHSCLIERIEKKGNETVIYTRLGPKVIGITKPISHLKVRVGSPPGTNDKK